MALDKDDLKLWEEWTNKVDKNINVKTISENGKKILNTIKENRINSEEYFETESNLKENNFILEKEKTLGIDKNSDKKLKKGEFKIDYVLDLHSLKLDEAYNKVYNLFQLSIKNNYKFLLIITGKGIHSQKNSKTIKESMIDWLKEPFFSNKIIKYMDAEKKHGGDGALYILLKNKK